MRGRAWAILTIFFAATAAHGDRFALLVGNSTAQGNYAAL